MFAKKLESILDYERKIKKLKMNTGAIILSGGSGTRLSPATQVLNKHFLPIFDKPMIYYSLSIAMLSGIRDIVIVCAKNDEEIFTKIIGNEEYLGVNLQFAVQEKPLGLPDGINQGMKISKYKNNQVILGDNFLYGSEIFQLIEKDILDFKPKIYVQRVKNSKHFGVVEINEHNKIVNIIEKPKNNNENYFAITGIYLIDDKFNQYFKSLSPSKRGEFEIIDILKSYLINDNLNFTKLGRGTAWFDMGSYDDFLTTSNFVNTIQAKQNILVCSPHEIAFRKGWVSDANVEKYISTIENSKYAEELKKIIINQ